MNRELGGLRLFVALVNFRLDEVDNADLSSANNLCNVQIYFRLDEVDNAGL